jgi:uridine phosphorylase
LWFVESGLRNVAVAGRFGIGAPVAAMVLEELVALGTREFVSIGIAGCLQPRCQFGAAVVCAGAIRDEGVSHHYLPAEKFAWPSDELTARLAGTAAWTWRPRSSSATTSWQRIAGPMPLVPTSLRDASLHLLDAALRALGAAGLPG